MTAKPPRRPVYRRAVAALGALSAIPLAGCSAVNPGTGQTGTPPLGSPPDDVKTVAPFDCDDEASVDPEGDERLSQELELESLRTKARAIEYLLEQVESGFPADVLDRGQEVGLAARPGVVTLRVIVDGFPVGTATAWFVDEGLLFTNAHNVFEPGSEIQGFTHDGMELDLEVVDFVEEFPPDVALLRTPHRGATTLPMARVDDLEAGQPLVQVGHPGEVGYWITSMGRFVEASQSYSSDGTEYTALISVVPGRQGVSGSPVLTLDGEVVGMTHGGEDFEVREMGEPATVAPDIVFDGPIGAIGMSRHDGSDILERKLEEWR